MAPSTRLTSEASVSFHPRVLRPQSWKRSFSKVNNARTTQETYRVDKEEGVREDVKHGLETVLDFLASGNTRRVDIIDTRADLVRVTVLLEGVEELHVALGSFDGNNISIETLDGWEDIIKIGVAEVGVSLELISNTSGGELERVNSPFEVSIPVSAAKGQLEENVNNRTVDRNEC